VPLQAELQHRLSAHWPVTQSLPTEQVCPCLVLQAPLESQIWLPEQFPSGSSAPVIGTQVPPPPVQARHVPQLLVVQQRPSTQLPVVHWLPAVQVSPGLLLQLPALSQVRVPEQLLSGSSVPVTATQVPPVPVHDWQVPQAAARQQRPSTQWSPAHWLSAVQTPPAVMRVTQAPAELQYCVDGHGAVVGLHAPAHVVAFAQRLLLHDTLIPGLQPPNPSQVGAGAAMPPVQVGLPQVVVVPL
jgi:hypothetical protein